MHYLLVTKSDKSSMIQSIQIRVIVDSPREAAIYLYRSREDNGESLNDEADLYAIDEERMMVWKVSIPKIKFEE